MHSLEDVQAAVKAAVDRKPNAENPFDVSQGNCLNTGRRGAHCIAAQVLVDFGYKVPAYGENLNDIDIESICIKLGIAGNFTKEAMEFLEEAQWHFDNPRNGRRPKWRVAYRQLQKDWESRDDDDVAED